MNTLASVSCAQVGDHQICMLVAHPCATVVWAVVATVTTDLATRSSRDSSVATDLATRGSRDSSVYVLAIQDRCSCEQLRRVGEFWRGC